MASLWIYALSILILYGASKLLRMGARERSLPPGPPTVPVLGNLHQIPLTGFYKKYDFLLGLKTPITNPYSFLDYLNGERNMVASSH